MNVSQGIETAVMGIGMIILIAVWFYLLEIITNTISVRAGLTFGVSCFVLILFVVGALH